MKYQCRITIVCLLALVLPVGSMYGAGYSPRVGELHGELVLPNIADGAPVALSDFRGKKVLLIHFASW